MLLLGSKATIDESIMNCFPVRFDDNPQILYRLPKSLFYFVYALSLKSHGVLEVEYLSVEDARNVIISTDPYTPF